MYKLSNVKDEKVIFSIVFLIICLLFFFTNKYNSFESSISSGFSDFIYYKQLAQCGADQSFNSLNDLHIPVHFAERWIPNFILGFFSNILNLDLVTTYRFFTFLVFMLLIFILYNTTYSLSSKICYFLILFLNPYTFRSYFFGGLNFNDCLFFFSVFFLVLSIDKKNIWHISIAIIIGSCSRQTVVFFIPIFFIFYFINKIKFKEFVFLSSLTVFCLLALKFSVNLLFVKMPNTTIIHIYGLFIWIKGSPSLKDLYPFITRLFLFISLLSPMILLKYLGKKIFPYLFSSFMLVLQPILAGPIITSAGGLRLFAFALPFLCYPILNNYQKKSYIFIILIMFFLLSLHHKYSVFTSKVFYFYLVVIIVISCLAILVKNNISKFSIHG